MSRRAFNKKYLTLSNVRVAYRPNDDTIHLTSTDRDLAGEAFRVTLKPGTEADQIMRELLYEKGLIREKSVGGGLLPTHAALKLDSEIPWYSFEIGEGVEGPVGFDIRSNPTVIISGATGTGKSIIQRTFIHHCLTHNDHWAVYGVDLTGVELKPYLRYETTVREITTSVGDTLLMFLQLQNEMQRRYALMEKRGVNNFLDIEENDPEAGDTKAFMIIVDEAAALFKDDSNRDPKAREMIQEVTLNLIRLGRAALIHVVLASQKIEDANIPKVIEDSAVKIACGSRDSEFFSVGSGDDTLTKYRPIRGRGMLQIGNDQQAFQAYFSSSTSGEEWVLEHGKSAEPVLYKKLLEEG